MTNEKAIELLDDLVRSVNCGEIELNEEDGEALRMAIYALNELLEETEKCLKE